MLAACARWSMCWIIKQVCTVIKKKAKSILRTRYPRKNICLYTVSSKIELLLVDSSVVYAPVELTEQFMIGLKALLELDAVYIYPAEMKLELHLVDDYTAASLVEMGFGSTYSVFLKSSVEVERAIFALNSTKMIEILKKIKEEDDE